MSPTVNRLLALLRVLLLGLLTFFLVRIVSTFVIVYGRRRTALMILVGYGVGILLSSALAAASEGIGDPVALSEQGAPLPGGCAARPSKPAASATLVRG